MEPLYFILPRYLRKSCICGLRPIFDAQGAEESRGNVTGKPAFQLPTFSLAIVNPISMSVSRDIPRQMTMLPGGPSPARSK